MYNHELVLISYEKSEDDVGNEIKETIETTVLCKLFDVGQTEFYNAKIAGVKPEMKFVVHDFEYDGQREIVFQSVKYQVIRTYQMGHELSTRKRANSLKFDEIELTCERVVGHGS